LAKRGNSLSGADYIKKKGEVFNDCGKKRNNMQAQLRETQASFQGKLVKSEQYFI